MASLHQAAAATLTLALALALTLTLALAYIRPQRLLVLRTEDYFARPLRGVRQVWRLLTLTLALALLLAFPADH